MEDSVDTVTSSTSHSSAPRRCIACGYDLRGLPEARCPECGVAFDPDALPTADIPWLRRRESGMNFFAAYYRTVWLVLVHPRAFARNVELPVEVNLAQAEWFRHFSVVIATGSVLLTWWIALAEAIVMLIGLVVVALPSLVFFTVATMPSAVAAPVARDLAQHVRFERLTNFACAPLGLAPALPILLFLAMLVGRTPAEMIGALLWTAVVIGALWWTCDLTFGRIGGRLSASEWLGLAIRLPILFLAGATAAFLTLFMLAVLVMIVRGLSASAV